MIKACQNCGANYEIMQMNEKCLVERNETKRNENNIRTFKPNHYFFFHNSSNFLLMLLRAFYIWSLQHTSHEWYDCGVPIEKVELSWKHLGLATWAEKKGWNAKS